MNTYVVFIKTGEGVYKYEIEAERTVSEYDKLIFIVGDEAVATFMDWAGMSKKANIKETTPYLET